MSPLDTDCWWTASMRPRREGPAATSATSKISNRGNSWVKSLWLPRIYKDYIRRKPPLSFGLDGEERPSAHRQQEAAEGPPVRASQASPGCWPAAGGHGPATRQAPGFRQLLRIRGASAGSAGAEAGMRGPGDL